MGEPKNIRQLLNTGKAKCNEAFDPIEHKNVCKTYVSRCVAQTRAGLDEFKICTKSGHCESVTSFEQCIDTAVFLAGEFETWGGFGEIRKKDGGGNDGRIRVENIRERRIVDKMIVPGGNAAFKDRGRMWKNEKMRDELKKQIFKVLRLDEREPYEMYVLDDDFKFLFVDGPDKSENCFYPDAIDSNDKLVVFGKDGSLSIRKGGYISEMLEELALYDFSGISIDNLIKYRRVLVEELGKLKRVLARSEVDMDAVVGSYEKIKTAALDIYKGVDPFGSLTSWKKGTLPKHILKNLDYEARRGFAFSIAKHFADTGDVLQMDDAFEYLIGLSDGHEEYVDKKIIAGIRQYGYVKKIKAGFEKVDELFLVRKGSDTKFWFVSAMNELTWIREDYLEARILGTREKLFGSENTIVFSDREGTWNVSRLRKRASELRESVILQKAEEMLEAARDNGTDTGVAADMVRKKLYKGLYESERDSDLKVRIEKMIKKYE